MSNPHQKQAIPWRKGRSRSTSENKTFETFLAKIFSAQHHVRIFRVLITRKIFSSRLFLYMPDLLLVLTIVGMRSPKTLGYIHVKMTSISTKIYLSKTIHCLARTHMQPHARTNAHANTHAHACTQAHRHAHVCPRTATIT